MSQEDLTCNGCVWLKPIADRLPHDKTGFLCREPDWGGYVTPEMPACTGREKGRRFLIKFAPERRPAKTSEVSE